MSSDVYFPPLKWTLDEEEFLKLRKSVQQRLIDRYGVVVKEETIIEEKPEPENRLQT